MNGMNKFLFENTIDMNIGVCRKKCVNGIIDQKFVNTVEVT